MYTMVPFVVMGICLIALADPASGAYSCLDGKRPLVDSYTDSFYCTVKRIETNERVYVSERELQTRCNADPSCTGYEYRKASNYGYICNQPRYPGSSRYRCCGAKLCQKLAGTTTVGGHCPQSHPYAYKNGDYCCASTREKVNRPQGAACDGSIISLTSGCCSGDRYTRCESGKCVNFPATKSCPSSYPYAYRQGEYCCKYGYEKVHRPQGAACDGSRISYSSRCCQHDAYRGCLPDKCVNYSGKDTPYTYEDTYEDEPRRQRNDPVEDIYVDIYED